MSEWAPVVNDLHSTSYSLLKEFLDEIVGVTKVLPTNEVCVQLDS